MSSRQQGTAWSDGQDSLTAAEYRWVLKEVLPTILSDGKPVDPSKYGDFSQEQVNVIKPYLAHEAWCEKSGEERDMTAPSVEHSGLEQADVGHAINRNNLDDVASLPRPSLTQRLSGFRDIFFRQCKSGASLPTHHLGRVTADAMGYFSGPPGAWRSHRWAIAERLANTPRTPTTPAGLLEGGVA